jgi:ABC-type transport system involved in multi-copper enzyme maturation permease subunit
MLLHIVRKELLDQLLSLRFAIACVVCSATLMVSAVVHGRNYTEATDTYHVNKVMHRNDITKRTRVFDLWQGVTVDRPLNVMNVLVRGMNGTLTESVTVQVGKRLDFPENYEKNPLLPLFPTVDFVFVVGIVLSLLAVTFSYDSISGEKESGVLRVMMSYSVPRDLVLAGKWIGGYLALVIPFFLAFLVALVVLALFPDVVIGPEDMLATTGLLAASLLYLAVIYSLGLMVSARTDLASTSISVLLLIWVVLILAVPNMAPYAAARVRPVPSRESVDREKMEIQRERSRQYQAKVEEEAQRTGKTQMAVYQDTLFQARMKDFTEESQKRRQRLEDDYTARVQARASWSRLLARLSPLSSFNLASINLAAAGVEQERLFVEALRTYSTTWEEYSKEKRVAFDEYMKKQRENSTDGRIIFDRNSMAQFNNLDLSDYPHFEFSYRPFLDRLADVYVDFLLLGIWAVVLFLLAYLSFLRYEV